jgi:dTDP-glucose 4,6-dehydratase
MHPLPAADLDDVLRATEPLWEGLRGGRLFLTGGTGFFGSWLLESFVRADDALGLGARAVVLTRDPDAFRRKAPHVAGHPALRLLAGELRSFPFPDGPFTHVLHAASPLPGARTAAEAAETLDAIVGGTRRVLELAVTRGAGKLLYVSSGAVHGRQPPGLERVAEDCTGGPPLDDFRSAYGEGKRAAELYCRAAGGAAGVAVTIARGFAFAGPHLPLDGGFALGNFLRDALARRTIVVSGDGTPYRSYLYAADMAAWLWTILIAGRPGEAYNVGSEEALSVGELARLVAEAAGGCGVEVRGTPVPGRPAERYVPSTRKARQQLGLAARVPLREAVRRTAEWLRGAAHRPN